MAPHQWQDEIPRSFAEAYPYATGQGSGSIHGERNPDREYWEDVPFNTGDAAQLCLRKAIADAFRR